MEIPVKKVDTLKALEWEDIRKEKEAADNIDFKMVTFSLGGKDYSIDIMKVKEISKANKFTYVPNALPYVRGVYNLRGDIISVIDLRLMFHLPLPERPDGALENMIILRLNEYPVAVLVDTIDRVVGLSSEKIQPPHPLFGDINIRFISGIVEHDKRLFIILDVERIFGTEAAAGSVAEEQPEEMPEDVPEVDRAELDLSFITETLATFRGFYYSPVNESWLRDRLEEWKSERGMEKAVQLEDPNDADDFLSTFYSPSTGRLWRDEYRKAFVALLPPVKTGTFTVWNIGCGAGYEAYSLACILHDIYASARLKIWAQDVDLMAISAAPNLVFRHDEIPEYFDPFVQEGKEGLQCTTEIKDLIMFEYHDARNSADFPNVDLIVARDVLSFMKPDEQEILIRDFSEKLKPGGMVMIGSNEALPETEWSVNRQGSAAVFKKR